MKQKYALQQRFISQTKPDCTITFDFKPLYPYGVEELDVINVNIRKDCGHEYDCVVIKDTGKILHAYEKGNPNNMYKENMEEKAWKLFELCDYTESKLKYVANFIYNME